MFGTRTLRPRAITLRPFLLVALGGAVGAVLRYGVGLAALRVAGPGVPWGTWAANALGCLLIGLALPLARGDDVRLALLVGVLGSFTTFSTYSADTLLLWEAGRRGLAVANAAGSVAVGLAFVAVGLAVGRSLAAG
ncbi:fluoride efflux transporter CrcB [Rubrivirga sp.]|uniref:fluoride efflux transporter CrcB n=1 Tax=Rubrivirga sp. TaxID=1885344 RepID=UPI003B526835